MESVICLSLGLLLDGGAGLQALRNTGSISKMKCSITCWTEQGFSWTTKRITTLVDRVS